MWDSRHLGTVIDFGSQMRAMTVEDRPQLCGATTSLGMGGFGKTSRRYVISGYLEESTIRTLLIEQTWEQLSGWLPKYCKVNCVMFLAMGSSYGSSYDRLDIPDNMDPDIANTRQCWKK